MGFRNTVRDFLYIAVGAAATGIEALANAAGFLVEKGEKVVLRGKEVFNDFCSEHFFPDDEKPTVIIEEDAVQESTEEAQDAHSASEA